MDEGCSLAVQEVAVADVQVALAVAALQPAPVVVVLDQAMALDQVVVRDQVVVPLWARLAVAVPSSVETLFMVARWLVDAEPLLPQHLRRRPQRVAFGYPVW